ncbi:hypothetical protein CERSUDRAFT_96236 [Gelatoporia subvermispora B]|uniref:RING-type E3 ubiquitin transferase n=1 Tax=Ceriporiopsis subvermispora (strain B) TaxID=914234 RepID=M2RC98_CERS8|nr:hypothetical protein CERSUDRAFT_96236 [Gelatoporia subvermispora B]
MTPRADSPPSKRIKLNASSSPPLDAARTVDDPDIPHDLDDSDVEQCSICLQPLADRTIIPKCSHEFCFECLLVWTEQSRKCPLCTQTIGDYLIHHVRSKYDYQKHYLTPLRSSSRLSEGVRAQTVARRRAQTRREQEWGRRRWREQEEADELERAIEHRRWVYRHKLYAKHVASNPYTRYKPFPTPAQFAASPDHISRATIFLRRELRVWPGLDVEFLTTFTISLMKSLDIRSEPAVRLLAEFLDMDNGGSRVNAEHFAHELYSFMRSPYRELPLYDRAVQVLRYTGGCSPAGSAGSTKAMASTGYVSLPFTIPFRGSTASSGTIRFARVLCVFSSTVATKISSTTTTSSQSTPTFYRAK